MITFNTYSTVGFTGSQEGMSRKQKDTLRQLFEGNLVGEFHHGDCIGADKESHDIAMERPNIVTVIHPPINETKRAFCGSLFIKPPKNYLERNHDIVNETDFLIAAPAEDVEQLRSGTWATVRFARKQGKTVWILER